MRGGLPLFFSFQKRPHVREGMYTSRFPLSPLKKGEQGERFSLIRSIDVLPNFVKSHTLLG
jgi:hypothetical protein